jgi:phosphomethylpyrimidine synthase
VTPISLNGKPDTTELFPKSRRIYETGKLYSDLRVPFREVTLAPTKRVNGSSESNDPVRVYDCSGPWGDPKFHGNVELGLPALRRSWILERGDVEEVQPATLKSERQSAGGLGSRPSIGRPLRAKPGAIVTQLHYARHGIITPEMEFVAIRENLGRELDISQVGDCAPLNPGGMAFARITPEFVRSEVARGRAISQRESSGGRTHDHWQELPGQNQRQHRQLSRHLRH